MISAAGTKVRLRKKLRPQMLTKSHGETPSKKFGLNSPVWNGQGVLVLIFTVMVTRAAKRHNTNKETAATMLKGFVRDGVFPMSLPEDTGGDMA